MTELLDRALTELAKLPAEAQDAFAARILAELEDEAVWSGRFSATTDEQWANLAAMVRLSISAGGLQATEDVMASEPSDA